MKKIKLLLSLFCLSVVFLAGAQFPQTVWTESGVWMYPAYGPPIFTPAQPTSPSPSYNNSTEPRRTNNSNSTQNNKKSRRSCTSCGTTGKCQYCYGKKVRTSFGNTHTCTVCDAYGNCSICKGTGYLD